MSALLLIISVAIQLKPRIPESIIANYSVSASEAVLVIDDSMGCYWVINGVLKQVVFKEYSERYDNDYTAFLSDLFDQRIEISSFKHIKTNSTIQRMTIDQVVKHYLLINQDGTLSFKKNYSVSKKISILKQMFDNGYYVLYDDYRASFYFSTDYPFFDL